GPDPHAVRPRGHRATEPRGRRSHGRQGSGDGLPAVGASRDGRPHRLHLRGPRPGWQRHRVLTQPEGLLHDPRPLGGRLRVTSPATADVVTAYLQALSAGNVDAAVSLVADDFHNEHTSSLGNSLHGREAYRERLPRFLAEFTQLRYE